MTIATMPLTDLGSAAASVVDKLEDQRRRSLAGVEWAGGKISLPGCYVMPIEAYHGDCCDGPSISSSGLRKIAAKSPAHYWCDSYLNPEREEDAEESDALRLGRAAHHLLLGETEFSRFFCMRPDHFDSWRTKEAKQWRAMQMADGKTVLIDSEIKAIRGMANSLAAHPVIRTHGLLNGEIERSLIWMDKETGVWLKARPDAVPVDTDVADLKTTADASARGCQMALSDRGYHMQMALIGMGMEEVLGRKASELHYHLVFVEKKPPYAVVIQPVDSAAIYWARLELRRAIRRFAECFEKNDWPAYDHDMQTLRLPDWYVKKLEWEVQNGLLADDAA